MYEALGLGEGALTRVVRAAYRALGLISFYTLGPKDARAWAIRRNALLMGEVQGQGYIGQALGAAVVCSDLPAYAGSVRPGETGLLVENRPEAWEEALEGLVADDERRQAIARAGRRHLHAERVLARRAPDWRAAIAALC